MNKQIREPWKVLDNYRGEKFEGDWPTITQAFDITVGKFPDRPVFTYYEEGKRISLTYKEAHHVIHQLATTLIRKGVTRGDKIILTGINSSEWAVAYLAILYTGAIVVPLDKEMNAERISSISKRVKAVAIFADDKKIQALSSSYSKAVFNLTSQTDGYIHNHLSDDILPMPRTEFYETAAILFTSGTTGAEKGAIISHRGLVSDSFLSRSLMDITHTDVFYCLLPIHHAYCMTAVFMISITTGAEIIFAKNLAMSNILSDLKAAKVTMFLGIPLLFNKLINGIMAKVKAKGIITYGLVSFLMALNGFLKKWFKINIGKQMFKGLLDKASLLNIRIMISGGGPLTPKTVNLYNQLGLDFVQGYGLTETGPIITLNPIWHYKESSVGKVIAGADLKIIDMNDEGIGEIVVKGDMLFEGYYEDTETTAEAFTNDGYFMTGDLGWRDSDNYIYITGRKKNIIVTQGGKNVYPEEIEYIFQLNSEFDQLLITGYIADEKLMSEAIEALIYPNADFFKNKTQNEMDAIILSIIREGNRNLTSYQQIDRVRLLDTPLEVSGTQKIKRFLDVKDRGRIIT